jgi:hypothetical protein
MNRILLSPNRSREFALGTLGLPEAKLRELCLEGGLFKQVRRVPVEIPFNNLYEIIA